MGRVPRKTNNFHYKENVIQFKKQPPEVFYIKGFLKNFERFPGKNLRRSLFFNKVAGLKPAILLTREALAQAFLCEYFKFLRKPLI